MIEALAEYSHQAWAKWMVYLFRLCSTNDDGSMRIPKHLVERWKRQAGTAYIALPGEEKDSDRVEARKILGIRDDRLILAAKAILLHWRSKELHLIDYRRLAVALEEYDED